MGYPTPDLASQSANSPMDATAFALLILAGLVVLWQRSKRTKALLKANWLVVIYFGFCLLSVLWSDFPVVAFKRWTKAIGDLVMVLIVFTEALPVRAFGRFLTRIGFVLVPASLLFIRYFGNLGRGYDPDGRPMYTGVTTNKNVLGVITFVTALGSLWYLFSLFDAGRKRNHARQLLARGTLLGMSFALLIMAHSATSLACFMLGSAVMLITRLKWVSSSQRNVHAVVLSIVVFAGVVMLFGGQSVVVHALGRQTTLTGRTDIWAAVLPVVPNRVLGAGFESFWMGPRLNAVYSRLSDFMHVNEAHNGYIEVYLNLGIVGVGLLVMILVSAYRGAVAAIRFEPRFGGLMLAYIVTAALYSITEAGFRMLDPMWIFLLLAAVGGHAITLNAVPPTPSGNQATLFGNAHFANAGFIRTKYRS
jgi:O-antigen ligase